MTGGYVNRAVLGLAAIVVLAVGILVMTSEVARRVRTQQMSQRGDDLGWLKQEFSLGDRELGRIRRLHEGYLPQCRESCERIAAKSRELEQVLSLTNVVTIEAELKLKELALLRAECQTRMLRHFKEVASAMPPEQAQRYCAEMQRLTLGNGQPYDHPVGVESPHGHH